MMEASLFIAAAVIFALVAAIPDLLARFAEPGRWVPVNSPPYSLGDDYHYFSVLNLFHRVCLQNIAGEKQLLIPFSAPSRFVFASLLFNILPYHLGYAVGDRRTAILAVRLWNHALFFLAAALVTRLLFELLGVDAPVSAVALTVMLHYVSYPSFLSLAAKSSILFNLGADGHMFRNGQPNDISRAFNLGTSGTLFLFCVAWLLLPATVQSSSALQSGFSLVLNALLYYAYLPLACVYGLLLLCRFAVDLNSAPWAAAAVALNAVCLGLHFAAAARDRVMREVLTHGDEGRLLSVSGRKMLEAAAVLCAPWVMRWLTPEMPGSYMTLLVATSLCVGTLFLAKHQGPRFWDRGGILLYQLLLLTWAIAQLIGAGTLGDAPAFLALAAVTAVLVAYELRNARQLLESANKLAPAWIADIGFFDDTAPRRQRIATDSIEVGYYAFLYTDHYSLLKNYSIAHGGYQKNLEEFCLSFRLAGYRLQDVVDLFSIDCRLEDWREKRPLARADRVEPAATIHTLQFMATYKEFNQALRTDGMYDASGWTPKMTALIEQVWISLESGAHDEHRVIVDPGGAVRKALSELARERGGVSSAPRASRQAV